MAWSSLLLARFARAAAYAVETAEMLCTASLMVWLTKERTSICCGTISKSSSVMTPRRPTATCVAG